VKIETFCPVCGQTATVEVPDAGFAAWQSGVLIQRALASVPKEHRELLVTGIDDKCWKAMFAEEES